MKSRLTQPWRPSELERVRQLREEGRSWASIGEAIGRSEASVYSYVAMLKDEDWSALDIVEDAQPRPTTPKFSYRNWKLSEVQTAREMRSAGHSWVEVGEKLGRQPDAVATHIRRLEREQKMVEVTGKRNARYAKLTEHERTIVDAMLNDGLGVRAIGEHVGRHWFVISTHKRARHFDRTRVTR